MSFLPDSDKKYLTEKNVSCREVIDGGQKGLIISDWALPTEKFDHEKADLLILLPQGYPDIPPDMFYLYPAIKLMPHHQYAKASDQFINFEQKQWQRWSRHFPREDWRSGTDGMHSYLKKIEEAIRVAAP